MPAEQLKFQDFKTYLSSKRYCPGHLVGAAAVLYGSFNMGHKSKYPNNVARQATFEITALVRSPEKAKLLESKFDVKTIVGHHGELDKLEQLASQADIVFSCSGSDDLPMIKAVLSGLRNRHATFGDLPIFIHTSGTGMSLGS
ncbi:hypothetical protein OBBRIDRAFT_835218 [Obba rivulosa]|uniref:NAD(P)-binding domain-containing protein n=1 Tax=Obba rivulosa TaxID=1052685 RepID=A0A8E2AT69_9APHY|nr:hypothetical protein OBBRIDRAFT_835218 [Obba rivulosa]